MKRIIGKLFSTAQDYVFYFKNRSLIGLKWKDYHEVKSKDLFLRGSFTSNFFGKQLSYTSPFWFWHSVKEIFIDEVYKLIPSNEQVTIIDCGANIGLSVLYLKSSYQKAHIIAFEPDPQIFKLLKHNVEAYRYNNVELVNAAVWNEETLLPFAAEGSVGGRLANASTANIIEVPTIRLRNYLNQKVFFLKIDIEGAEYEVLEDCRDHLENVENLFVEYHSKRNDQQKLHTILQWVEEAGFQYYIKEAWNNMTHPFMKTYKYYYHMQLNIYCFRQNLFDKGNRRLS